MTTLVSCRRCGGSGYDPEIEREIERRCPHCGGDGVGGYVTREMSIDGYGDTSAVGEMVPCGTCNGQGQWIEPEPDACSRCGGRGEVPA